MSGIRHLARTRLPAARPRILQAIFKHQRDTLAPTPAQAWPVARADLSLNLIAMVKSIAAAPPAAAEAPSQAAAASAVPAAASPPVEHSEAALAEEAPALAAVETPAAAAAEGEPRLHAAAEPAVVLALADPLDDFVPDIDEGGWA